MDRKPVIAGQMLAELKFAFWVGLLGKHYDPTIWRRAIYKAFLGTRGQAAQHCSQPVECNSGIAKSDCAS